MFWTRSLCCASLLMILGGRAAGAQTSAGPAEEVLQRVMPQLAPQFQLRLRSPGKEGDSFRVSGTAGHNRSAYSGATRRPCQSLVRWVNENPSSRKCLLRSHAVLPYRAARKHPPTRPSMTRLVLASRHCALQSQDRWPNQDLDLSVLYCSVVNQLASPDPPTARGRWPTELEMGPQYTILEREDYHAENSR